MARLAEHTQDGTLVTQVRDNWLSSLACGSGNHNACQCQEWRKERSQLNHDEDLGIGEELPEAM
jgi:hypothetical protein